MKTNTYKASYLIIAINLFINIIGLSAAVTFAFVKSIFIINAFTYCLLLYVIYCYRQTALHETRERLEDLLDLQQDNLQRRDLSHYTEKNINFLLLQYAAMMDNVLVHQSQSGIAPDPKLKDQVDALNVYLKALI
ncbi:hypothetical protein DIU31_022585 [Mucilaginibacter rubeus]|uniref:Uncharacterized protein n=2 Tax=Mucilaginibacter rubeus TaxID=2027860 RepID=A0A364WTG6_9SPHI|nr:MULTISPECIES: hypothetical protein [Mucilaginibacter]QEM06165.1 hypothetical protein DIU31_022585 [Mucilaginibacter rubeus]QEM13682.1 hypothetical protein DEO27_027940 [Mucilaginibacter rubeus]QEM18747.1 hypothetical protein DIU38_022820 [Mucilaginibacter gossypii]QTE36259.1 hypothetical protein J3L18_24480 [Mucilaginibacter gossypii]QTE44712.1 hypothetical protein J3L19_04905 [Mucilaginibacter rubeus]